MTQDEKLLSTIVAVCMAPVGMAAGYYVKVTLIERKKRKAIEAWKKENLACIQQSRDRLLALLESPDLTQEEFRRVYNEESKFLSIVRNQPAY